MDLKDLNKEQQEAVLYKSGPLLIVAGAGTGKTTVITRRIAHLIESGVNPNEILGVTFTDKAAGEMEERVDRLLPFGYLDLWISTFHSFCERVLKEHGLDIGLPTDFKLVDQTSAWLMIKNNLDKFDLDYYKPMGNPTKFIHAMIKHFSRLKDEAIYPEEYLQYADDVKKHSNIEDIEERRIKEIANAYHFYQRLLLENDYLDFGDLINYCLKLFEERPQILKKYQDQFKYILVDEFQDTNWAQYELIKKLVADDSNLTVTADDDQCLPGDSRIQIFHNGKIIEKEIKDVKKGEMVLTGVGKGHIGISKINKVFKKKKKARVLTINTKNGNKLRVTDNHKMFCFVPKTYRKGFHYVYLMYRSNLGWRMGVTDDLILRLTLERSADYIIGIKAFDTDEEARYYETLWSLKYGIPTSCFKERDGIVIKGKLLDKLYQELDVSNNTKLLAKELNVDLGAPHHCLNAVYRGDKSRVIINLNMCSRKHRSKEHVKKGNLLLLNAPIKHQIFLETSDPMVIKNLIKAGFHMKDTKKGKALRLEYNSLQEAVETTDNIKELTQGIIKIKFNIGSKYHDTSSHRRTYNSVVMPAKNLLRGHCLPIRMGTEIIYDQIVNIKEKESEEIVYDLEINNTHNFIANGVAVHNSIFRFRGASTSNVLQFKKDFPKAKNIVLTQNYRSYQEILDLSYDFIQSNNPDRLEFQEKIDKRLIANNKGKASINLLHFTSLQKEISGIADKILELDTDLSNIAILIRANSAAEIFSKEFDRRGISYQFLASKGLYSKPIILDIIAYLKVINDSFESSAINRILYSSFLSIPFEDLSSINQYSKKKGISTYETLNSIILVKGLKDSTYRTIELLMNLIKKHSRLKKTSHVFIDFINESGYLKKLVKEHDESSIDLIGQFYKKIKAFEETNDSLYEFIEQIDMELEAGDTGGLDYNLELSPDTLKIMTIHSAKGLEFDYVFIPNLVDKRFPTIKKGDSIQIPDDLVKEIMPQGDAHLQEERRLFYVALTRARKGLFLTYADDYGGTRTKKPSQFITELNIKKSDVDSEEDLNKKNKKDISYKDKIPTHFSYSQIEAFNKCPLQYKFAHILKIPRKGSYVFSFGKTIHNVFYKYLNDFNSNQGQLFDIKKEIDYKKEEQKILNLYEQEFIDEWYENDKQRKEYFKNAKNIIKEFLKTFLKEKPEIFKFNNISSLELDFKTKFNKDTFIGKIDRIDVKDNLLEIIDYKTGKSKDKLSKDDKEQLLIYQLAVKDVVGRIPEKMSYYYLDNNQKITFTSTEEEREVVRKNVEKKIEDIKNSQFDARPGFHCKFCDFKDICEFREL